jgi:plastocyanin
MLRKKVHQDKIAPVWLVNSEDALGKLNLGFLFPDENGRAHLKTSGSNQANLALPGFNMVVVTAETVLNSGSSQPSGPPIAAGHIPGTPAATTPLPAVEVLMGDLTTNVFSFEPQTITIFSGQTVRWTNVSPEFINPHTATRADDEGPLPNSDQAFDSGPVPFGHSFTRTFTLPAGAQFGFFNYHCTPHQQLGMTGRILVIANPTTCSATLTGAEETPPVTTSASGSATFILNPTTHTLKYNVTTKGLSGIAAHIHQAPIGQPGPIIFPFTGGPTQWSGEIPALSDDQVALLTSGGFYANVHTSANPGGEIRGQIHCP